ncbi:MAG: D-aminoacyl-tRNA deacylase [Lachnospirales bacterium]
MKVVLQRVNKSSVKINGNIVGEIGKGYLILLGVGNEDTEKDVEVLVDKISKLRIFPDSDDKINLSIGEVNGEILVVSQFTLYGSCKKGNRPSFINSGKPDTANKLYEYFKEYARDKFDKVESGVFGEDMKVELENDGPFTILLECENGVIY